MSVTIETSIFLQVAKVSCSSFVGLQNESTYSFVVTKRPFVKQIWANRIVFSRFVIHQVEEVEVALDLLTSNKAFKFFPS